MGSEGILRKQVANFLVESRLKHFSLGLFHYYHVRVMCLHIISEMLSYEFVLVDFGLLIDALRLDVQEEGSASVDDTAHFYRPAHLFDDLLAN
eukprot:CAMPEP_0170512130 /NCGR_PEP_ID=MMETSP0208-20121228/66680_1 /TAXON_ID=197538 /ORGANISM="Strombidium inclinatum, Strain S3" /LENGTH=92 /DNA_ID=CAMNT_0010795729 /DNA_START=1061 /DNA_END=1339 /DNA_ORIENTATION=+